MTYTKSSPSYPFAYEIGDLVSYYGGRYKVKRIILDKNGVRYEIKRHSEKERPNMKVGAAQITAWRE